MVLVELAEMEEEEDEKQPCFFATVYTLLLLHIIVVESLGWRR